ncbi:HPP family-domain-containing protein [Cristinia sonorae]|uniref:HPP family-domain-containing protein n=1 Tax=Cristinia sonorae TaxID=1940300 RepID=A0A8K0UCH5_9AGAR|nr:HPP family-domain-containing protein [Cristinia sonorae]
MDFLAEKLGDNSASRVLITVLQPSHPAAKSKRHHHRLATWPAWASRWLGYRAKPPPKLSKPLIWFWTFIGAFAGLAVLQSLFQYSSYFSSRRVPGIIASFGASATLIYGAIDSPLAQPRALVLGHFLSALMGVCITKLFETMTDKMHLEEVRWIAGCLSACVAIVVMQMTETTHPPAGATALLAAVNEPIYELGWYYLPIIILSSILMLVVALIINNIQRRYPVFWFRPIVEPSAPVSPALGGPQPDDPDAANPDASQNASNSSLPAASSSSASVHDRSQEKRKLGSAEGGDLVARMV